MTTITNNSNSPRLVFVRDFPEAHALKEFLEKLGDLYPDTNMDSFGIVVMDSALFKNRLNHILGLAGIDVVHPNDEDEYIVSRVPFPLEKEKMETLKALRIEFKDALVNNLPKSVALTPKDEEKLQAAKTDEEKMDISNNILKFQGFASGAETVDYVLTEESTGTKLAVSFSRLGGIGVEKDFPVLRIRFLDKENQVEISFKQIEDTINTNEKIRELHDKWIPFVGETLLVEEYQELVKDINAE